jgi:predicted 3-demethylubiquinone-9 3-methyltransferase (glyoxalase superfamily)
MPEQTQPNRTAVRPFLMFQGEGTADAAIALSTSLLPDGRVTTIERYGPGEQGAEGSIKLAEFVLAGQSLLCIDSPIAHAFGFTPSFSFFVDVLDEAAFERLTTGLLDGGVHLMPPDNYGFSRRFAWLNDRFGVSWQINLP